MALSLSPADWEVSVFVKRLCRIRNDSDLDLSPFPLDEDGFLTEPTVGVAKSRDDELVDPLELSKTDSFALLGEPGAGKSTVLGSIVDYWRQAIGEANVHEFDGGSLSELGYHDKLRPLLKALPAIDRDEPAHISSAPTLVVVIDQVDECHLFGTSLPNLLAESLEGRSTAMIRLVLASRLMDFKPAYRTALQGLMRFRVADLAPLTRPQAAGIAADNNVRDPDALLSAAVERSVAPLAGIPLTLVMLCEMYSQHEDLVGTAQEIFANAVLRFAERRGPNQGETDVSDVAARDTRLAVSQRVAAYLQLCGRRHISTGGVGSLRQTDLALADLVPGEEHIDETPLSVGRDEIVDAVKCALYAFGGDGQRVMFRHSSIAAYMTAQYLLERKVGEPQLRQLFLVDPAVGESWPTIPALLRETAAWLVALQPKHAKWLADADPLSLAGHSALVDNPATRALIVAALIRRADDAYLSDTWWRRRHLLPVNHPGLADQVLEALADKHDSTWRSVARSRILLDLAYESQDPRLGDRLTEIATSDTWDSPLRRQAADALAVCDPSRIAELKPLLMSLADDTRAAAIDPNDEIRGALLLNMWPNVITPAELFLLARKRPTPSFYGVYAHFLTFRAAEVAQASDALEVLSAIAEGLEPGADETDQLTAPSEAEVASEADRARSRERSRERVAPEDFIESMVDRALDEGDAAIPVIAALAEPYLRQYRGVAFPTALDESLSALPSERVTHLRRALARALAERLSDGDSWAAATMTVTGWQAAARSRALRRTQTGSRTRLLDAGDFRWAIHEADAHTQSSPELAAVFADMAALVLDPANSADYELAFDIHQQPPFFNSQLRWLFEPIPIDSPQARGWRRAHRQEQDDPVWEDGPDFIADLHRLLALAAEGDTDSFWQLAWQLQFDPATGRGSIPILKDDLTQFPAMPSLGGDRLELLRSAARIYLKSTHDHWDEWLGTDHYQKRGWAGYLALSLLDRAGEDLGEIPWPNWVGSIIWFLAEWEDDSRERRTALAATAAREAPREFAAALSAFTLRNLERGSSPYGLEVLNEQIPEPVLAALSSLMSRIREQLAHLEQPASDTAPTEAMNYALQTWRDIAVAGLKRNMDDVRTEVLAALELAPGVETSQISANAAALLMQSDPNTGWPRIRDSIGSDPIAAMPIALVFASRQHAGPALTLMTDDHLAEFFRWLHTLLPPEEDDVELGAHFVHPREDAQRLRGYVLEQLAQRATRRSLELLVELAREFDSVILHGAVRRARTELAEVNWRPPEPRELGRLLRDPSRRLVRTDAELAAVIIETLRVVEHELPPHCELLWDRVPASLRSLAARKGVTLGYKAAPEGDDLWAPKPEAALSAYLANQLDLRLAKRSLIVNREVLVHPTNPYGSGDRPDILVEVRSGTQVHCKVPIEVKGAWNQEAETSLETQLAKRYLPEARSNAGVYVVGWYPLGLWTALDSSRRPKAAGRSPDTLSADLDHLAGQVAPPGAVIAPIIITIPRPTTSA